MRGIRFFLIILALTSMGMTQIPGVNMLVEGDSATVLKVEYTGVIGNSKAISTNAVIHSLVPSGSGARGVVGLIDNTVAETAGSNAVGVLGTGHNGVWGEGTSIGVTGKGLKGVEGAGYAEEGEALGVWAYATAPEYSYGVYGNGEGEGAAYGVFGTAIGSPGYAGYFDGNVIVTGSFSSGSDAMLKKNIRILDGGLNKIMALKPKAYEMEVGKFQNIRLSEGKKFGLLAQEVESVIPELVSRVTAPPRLTPEERRKGVKKTPTQFKAVDYMSLIPILVKGMQEQQATIEALQAKIAKLEGR
jgi:hypothetical protein